MMGAGKKEAESNKGGGLSKRKNHIAGAISTKKKPKEAEELTSLWSRLPKKRPGKKLLTGKREELGVGRLNRSLSLRRTADRRCVKCKTGKGNAFISP